MEYRKLTKETADLMESKGGVLLIPEQTTGTVNLSTVLKVKPSE